jgi:hypothetical protein
MKKCTIIIKKAPKVYTKFMWFGSIEFGNVVLHKKNPGVKQFKPNSVNSSIAFIR